MVSPQTLNPFTLSVKGNQTYLKTDSVLVFTCGAEPTQSGESAREKLMDYARSNLDGYEFFKAEPVVRQLAEYKNRNVLKVEHDLAQIADCIIVIIESHGSICELGAFALDDKIASIVLSINDVRHQHADSFINEGPVDKINQESKFGPVIFQRLDTILRVVPEVRDRLERVKSKQSKRINLATWRDVKEADRKLRIFLIHDLVTLLYPVKHSELISALKHIYGDEHDYDIKTEIALLMAIEMISKVDGEYYRTSRESKLYYEYRHGNVEAIRGRVLGTYSKADRDRLSLLAA